MKHLGTQNLKTERLFLRKIRVEDAEELFSNLYSDEKVNRYISWNTHKNVEDTFSFLQECIRSYKDNVYKWVVCLKDSNKVIGTIEVINISERHESCEVGYQYSFLYSGKGYATEALKAVCDFLLYEVGFFLVEAKVREENRGSIRVCEKAGLSCDAILPLRRVDKLDGHRDSLKIYSIFRK